MVKVMPKLSSKNQVTIPVDVLRAAGIQQGEELVVRAVAHGRLEVASTRDRFSRFAGALPAGTFPQGYLDGLRDEWKR